MAVSAAEKNPESMISAARMENSKPSGASFKAGVDLVGESGTYLEEKAESEQALLLGRSSRLPALQYQLQHEFRAKKGQHQQREARERKAYGCSTAPAPLIVSPEQRGK